MVLTVQHIHHLYACIQSYMDAVLLYSTSPNLWYHIHIHQGKQTHIASCYSARWKLFAIFFFFSFFCLTTSDNICSILWPHNFILSSFIFISPSSSSAFCFIVFCLFLFYLLLFFPISISYLFSTYEFIHKTTHFA